jgi:membrane-bound lytic murein transglycosylase B
VVRFGQRIIWSRSKCSQFITELSNITTSPRPELEALFIQVQRQQRVIDLISKPAEKTARVVRVPPHLSRSGADSAGRAVLARPCCRAGTAESHFGVEPQCGGRSSGIETRYGRNTGTTPVLDALTTLAFDYPPRSKFFRQELLNYLLLAREEGKDPRSIKGSYAGAMGYGQFMPSSYRNYAVDFDGDGKRDIWNNRSDAIGSVASYFNRHGWQHNAPVVMTALPSAENPALALNDTKKPTLSVAQLAAQGVRARQWVEPERKAVALRLLGDAGPDIGCF